MPFLGGMHFENIAMVVQEIHVRVMDWWYFVLDRIEFLECWTAKQMDNIPLV